MRNEGTMKRTLVLALSLAAIAISLPACQKKPEEKLAEALTEMNNDKETIKRMNEIRRQGQGYAELLEKSGSSESKKATKAPGSETK